MVMVRVIKFPSTAVNENVRSPHWSNVSNIAQNANMEEGVFLSLNNGSGSGIPCASISLPKSTLSDGVILSGYNFNIPLNSKIDEIRILSEWYGNNVRDNHARILYSGGSSQNVAELYHKTNDTVNLKVYSPSIISSVSKPLPSVINNNNSFKSIYTFYNVSSTTSKVGKFITAGIAITYTPPSYTLSGRIEYTGYTNPVIDENFQYIITITNTNNADNGVPIPVQLTIPSNVTFVNSSTSNGTYNSTTKVWNAVLNNGVATLNLTLKPTSVSNMNINASVQSYNIDGLPLFVDNNTAFNVTDPPNEVDVSITSDYDEDDVLIMNEYTCVVDVEGVPRHSTPLVIDLGVPRNFDIITSTPEFMTNVLNYNIQDNKINILPGGAGLNIHFACEITFRTRTTGLQTFLINALRSAGEIEDSIQFTGIFDVDEPGAASNEVTQFISKLRKVAGEEIYYNAVGHPDNIVLFAQGNTIEYSPVMKGIGDMIKGYIGPLKLDRTHSPRNLKNSTKNTLIKKGYKNRVNIGKQGDYTETIGLTVRVPAKDSPTIQGMVDMDEPFPVNTNVGAYDADPLNHKGYAEIHGCDIKLINPYLHEVDINLEYLTRNLNPAIYIHRLSQINKYAIQSQYPVEIFDEFDDLEDYFNIESLTTIVDKTVEVSGTESAILTGKEVLSLPCNIEYVWDSEEMRGVERFIRLKDTDGNIIFEYQVYTYYELDENLDPVNEQSFANVSIYNLDGSVETDEYEIDLLDADDPTKFSTNTIINITDNVLSIIEEGNSGMELSLNNLIIEHENYKLETEIRNVENITSTTNIDFTINETRLLNDSKGYYLNQIVSSFPLRNKTLNYTRLAEDGLLYYYQHDESVAKYYTQPVAIYKGGCNVTTINGTSLLNSRYNADPIVMTNGLVKVVFSFSLREIRIYLFDNLNTEKWVLIERFQLINMENIKVQSITQDKVVMVCGGTTWTIWRGRHAIDIQHNTQDIYIKELKNTILRDDGDGVANEETIGETETLLSLNSLFYLLMYDSDDDYGLQIIRPDYASIYNTRIPKSPKTVLIPYKKDADDHDSPISLALEWLWMYEQKINIEG